VVFHPKTVLGGALTPCVKEVTQAPMADALQWLIPIAGIAAVLFALYLARDVLSRDKGPQAMQDVADTIREGADAFVKRQYTTIGILAVVGAVIIAVVIAVVETRDVADVPDLAGAPIGIMTGIAFLIGAACSMASGIIGMFISVRSNVRTAAAARHSLVLAVQVAMRGGAVSGFLVVALSLLGVWGIFTAYGTLVGDVTVAEAPFLIVGFGFGASFVALFAQLGGGIYTKAADVGSDLVGKVEAGIPEDDPRNAGVIADLVGDNVGDCAGRGADLFESTAAENIGAMILGVAAFAIAESSGWPNPEAWIFFPLVVRAFGLLATIVAMFFIRGSETEDPMNILNRGYWVTTLLSVVGLAITTFVMMDTGGTPGANGIAPWLWFFGAGLVGLATSVVFVYITQYYTAGTFRPVREIAEASKTGPATNIISGTAVGFETTFVTAVSIGVALIASHWLGEQAGLVNAEGHNVGGIFGTAVATMGMLMTTAYILAMDTFGPITDNAGGVAEFSRSEAGAREITDRLDAVGNTTKALTKGYAIASASLAAFLLFSAYIDKVNLIQRNRGGELLEAVNLADVGVFVAALIGAMLAYFFSSLAIRAVGKTAQSIIVEVRRQFREMPGIMDYTQRPDYARVVDITTAAALREMVAPGLVAVATPIIVGVLLGYQAVAGLLMVGTIAGVLLATVLNNGGGAWDNAKKYIEAGHLTDDSGAVIGKGTPAHAAAVVGDTVGDPFKDTAGPSLHVLVKLLATITLVLAPLFIR
ncbi:MAG TPA: sodium-translocating pyrophosphatase, partial [Candidatus Limnocylindrales bacterium]|nr:sodium-translocating pyrophosphatase [Candidatus Limnocylindrales bacterium]